jgi:small subunit ribosomal protein S18
MEIGCYFCERNINPNYKEIDVLKRFLNSNGEVQSIKKTECCPRHQFALKTATKKARELALLPLPM